MAYNFGADIDLTWGGAMIITPSGGISVVTGGIKVAQRVIRRFLTTSLMRDIAQRVIQLPDYLFHNDYGGGARYYVDKTIDNSVAQAIDQLFASQAIQEPGVVSQPPPTVNLSYNRSTGELIMDVIFTLSDGTVVSYPGTRIN